MKTYLVGTREQIGDLTCNYCVELSGLFGPRFYIEIIKRCSNIPGFAPTHYDRYCGQIVTNFKREQKSYWLNHTDPPNLDVEEVTEILAKMKEGFVEEKYPTVEELKTYIRSLREEE